MKKPNRLNVELSTNLPDKPSAAEAFALCVFAGEERPLGAQLLDESLSQTCEQLIAGGEFKGEEETSYFFYATTERDGEAEGGGAKHAARRLLLIGLGARTDFDSDTLRRAAGMAAREARDAHVCALHFVLPVESESDSSVMLRALVEGTHLGLY